MYIEIYEGLSTLQKPVTKEIPISHQTEKNGMHENNFFSAEIVSQITFIS